MFSEHLNPELNPEGHSRKEEGRYFLGKVTCLDLEKYLIDFFFFM